MSKGYGQIEIDKTLYALRKMWGVNALWKVYKEKTLNLQTGEQDIAYDSYTIRHAILLPSDIHRSKDLPGLSGIFKQGGFFDLDARHLLIKKSDLPDDYDIDHPNLNDMVTVDGCDYQITSIHAEYAVWMNIKRILP
jgi:hypothetical protein